MIKITPTQDGYQIAVPSFTADGTYTVTIPRRAAHLWQQQATCTCPQWTRTRKPCKHIVRVIEDMCALAPTIIFVPHHGLYSREPHTPAFITMDRHSWACVPTAEYILHPDEYRAINAPPDMAEIATGLILEYEDYGTRAVARIRNGIAYATDGSAITTRADLVDRPEWIMDWPTIANRELDKLLTGKR